MAKQILPKGTYKVAQVGPSSEKSFDGEKGKVTLNVTAVTLEGHESLWCEVNSASDKPAPVVGDELKGHVEQDDAGKWMAKFKKERAGGGGGWGGGGGQATEGAKWSAAFDTAAKIASGFLTLSSAEKKKKAASSIDQYMSLVEVIAVKLKPLVDAHAGETPAAPAAPADDKTTSESGESPSTDAEPAAAPDKKEVVIEDMDDDLGEW